MLTLTKFNTFARVIFVVIIMLVVGMAITPKASAATIEECIADKNETVLGLPKWYKYVESTPDSTGRCSLDFTGEDSESRINSALPIGIAVLEAVLRISGLVAVFMVFWGGFKFITAQGNPDKAKSARTTVINAMIGLVIVILSTAIVSFIGRSIS